MTRWRVWFLTVAVLLALSSVLWVTLALAEPKIPHLFFGQVRVGGEPAVGGLPIRVKALDEASNELVRLDLNLSSLDVTAEDGTFGVAAPFAVRADDPDTLGREGGKPGERLLFFVVLDGVELEVSTFQVSPPLGTEPVLFERAGNTRLDLFVKRVLTVTKTGDTNDGVCDADCSLREAIAAATSGDSVEVPAGTYTLTLGSELVIDKDLTLTGGGADTTIIQAATAPDAAFARVFLIKGATVAISGVMIRHGRVTGFGAGIWTDGTLTLTNTTVSDNVARGPFGGNGGGILNQLDARLTLTNSTVSGNTATLQGGGVFSNGTLTSINSTVSGNSAPNGAGIASFGTADLTNTIVASNLSSGDCAGNPITSFGHNLDSDGTCGLSATGDLPNIDPLLAPLQDNGGPTFTHALLPGSPAIDAGHDGAAPATDQRGVPRPQGAHSDIGAFEVGPSCKGHPSTIVGTNAGETITGTVGDDVIVAKGGNDTIRALGGDDVVCAGAGKDRVLGGKGHDVLLGGPGMDVLKGQAGNDKLFGNRGNDRLLGGAGKDVLRGGPGDDKLFGNRGDDRLLGGAGDDTIDCGNGSDTAKRRPRKRHGTDQLR